ncbi:hypothetical protein [Buchnera aphidicola]|uniref:Flagellar hook-basal body complex protein FliE n=1 Tax=Buchnera aphidicola (Cinara strobi) TaxID=1921549 RepID=A0A3B1E7M7_9GAMM|nr:hypothetical protein [Buchnera aphidicola]VAX76257.1 Flagellar hook-basal body complex protein FliE [Buchnera aphidicola (Cinara strobi)]
MKINYNHPKTTTSNKIINLYNKNQNKKSYKIWNNFLQISYKIKKIKEKEKNNIQKKNFFLKKNNTTSKIKNKKEIIKIFMQAQNKLLSIYEEIMHIQV